VAAGVRPLAPRARGRRPYPAADAERAGPRSSWPCGGARAHAGLAQGRHRDCRLADRSGDRTIIAPIFAIKGISDLLHFIGGPNWAAQSVSLKAFAWFELVISTMLMFAWCYAIQAALKWKRIFPLLFIGLCLATFAVGVLDVIIADVAFSRLMSTDDIRQVMRSFLVCAVCIPYMLRSRRVRGTFRY
jgi:hypothetical protein